MLETFYMKGASTKREIMGITSWLRAELTFVVVFLRLSRALWFALSAVTSIADPNGSVPSDPKLNA